MSKLTLSAEPKVVQMAKEYAAQHNTSVSALFAHFIQELVSHQDENHNEDYKSSTLSQLSGSVQLKKHESYDDLRRRAIKNRHGI